MKEKTRNKNQKKRKGEKEGKKGKKRGKKRKKEKKEKRKKEKKEKGKKEKRKKGKKEKGKREKGEKGQKEKGKRKREKRTKGKRKDKWKNEKGKKRKGQKEKNVLTNSIIEGLPGAEEGYNLNQFKHQLSHYEMVTENDLRKNLIHFLEAIIPTAERLGVKMCIHPDDPPISILGIPRFVSKLEDLEFIFSKIPSISNGLTYCTGSLGVLRENN